MSAVVADDPWAACQDATLDGGSGTLASGKDRDETTDDGSRTVPRRDVASRCPDRPGAGAATPEFKLCTKATPSKSGKYSSNTCSEASFVAAGGQKYEREGFPWTHAHKRGFIVAGHGIARWTVVNPVGKGGGPSEPAEPVLEPKCFESRLGPPKAHAGSAK